MPNFKFQMTNLIVIILLSGFFCVSVQADSLWNKDSSSPYSHVKSFKTGDIITILVIEKTSAVQKAGTNTNVKDEFGTKLNHSISKIKSVIPLDTNVDADVKNQYSGIGKTERSSYLSAKITAVVTEVLSNNNLRISGKHKISINDEVQEIAVSGVVRSKDVSTANTVYSYQIADADVAVKGSGVVGDAESPGWLTRFFNWLF